MGIRVRAGNENDIPWLVSQLREFAAFFGTKRSLFGSEEYVCRALKSMLADHVLVVAMTENEVPVGFIGGVFAPHIMNPEIKYLGETFWWVQEKYRATRAGLMLLDTFVDIGKRKADWITFGLEAKSPVSERHLLKRGFHLHERSYLHEVDNG